MEGPDLGGDSRQRRGIGRHFGREHWGVVSGPGVAGDFRRRSGELLRGGDPSQSVIRVIIMSRKAMSLYSCQCRLLDIAVVG